MKKRKREEREHNTNLNKKNRGFQICEENEGIKKTMWLSGTTQTDKQVKATMQTKCKSNYDEKEMGNYTTWCTGKKKRNEKRKARKRRYEKSERTARKQ